MSNTELKQMGISDCLLKTRLVDLGIDATDKAIFLQLCGHIRKETNDGYWCNPSHALLESECGFKSRRISMAVAKLRELGYVKTVVTKSSNIYYINASLIVEKHNLWRAHFQDKELLKEYSFGTVSKDAIDKFDKVVNKTQPNKNTSKLNNNRHVEYEDDPDCPF